MHLRPEHELPPESMEIIFRLAGFAILVGTHGMMGSGGRLGINLAVLLEMKDDISRLCSDAGPTGDNAQFKELSSAVFAALQRATDRGSFWEDCIIDGSQT